MRVDRRRRRARAQPVGPSGAARSAPTLLPAQLAGWRAEDAGSDRLRLLYIVKDFPVRCGGCGRPGRGLVCVRSAQVDDLQLAGTRCLAGRETRADVLFHIVEMYSSAQLHGAQPVEPATTVRCARARWRQS
jgi:hypothetical protein